MKPQCICPSRQVDCDEQSCQLVKHGQPYDSSQCRVCWLYHHSPRHRLAWDGEPSMRQKLRNLASSTLEHLRAGQPRASNEQFEQRMHICQDCPAYNPSANSCRLCGCHLSIKARWLEQRCPMGKWPFNKDSDSDSDKD